MALFPAVGPDPYLPPPVPAGDPGGATPSPAPSLRIFNRTPGLASTKIFNIRAGGRAVHRRYLHTTMVHNKGRGNTRLLTVIPAPALSILGINAPRFLSWERAGKYHRIIPSVDAVQGAHRLQNPRSHMAYVPGTVAKTMEISDHDNLDWYVAAGPGDRWEIHAGPADDPGPPPAGPPEHPSAKSVQNRRPIARTRLLPRPERGGRGVYLLTTVPKPCIALMGADPDGSIHWERRGGSYLVAPAGGERGARRLYAARGGSGLDHFMARVPASIRDGLPDGSVALRWELVSDGRGRWAVHAAPIQDAAG